MINLLKLDERIALINNYSNAIANLKARLKDNPTMTASEKKLILDEIESLNKRIESLKS